MMSSMVDPRRGAPPTLASGLDMAGLGARLRLERQRRGLSLHDLETRTGVSRSMLSEVERGSKVPTILVLDRIATGLDTSIARLLADDHSGGRGRRRVRPARAGLARVPRDGARRAQAHARWRGARAPCRRQHLLRRRLPPRVRQCGPRAVRLLPGDGARPPSRRRATPAPGPRSQEVNAMTGHPDMCAPPALDPGHLHPLAPRAAAVAPADHGAHPAAR